MALAEAESGPEAVQLSARGARGWNLSERRLLLVLGDLAIVIGAMLATQVVAETFQLATQAPRWALLLGGVWLAVARALNAYDLVIAARPRSALPRSALVAALTMGLYAAIPFWSPPLPAARWLVLLNVGLLFGPLLLWRAAYAMLVTRPAYRIPALVLGPGPTASAVAEILRERAWHAYELVGLLDHRPGCSQAPAFGADLVALVRERGIREVIVDTAAQRSPDLQAALLELSERRVTVTTATEMYESLTGRVLLPFLDPAGLSPASITMSLYAALRRLADLAVALGGLVAFAPPLLVAALAIRLDSPGPPLYWQQRVGRYGRPFRLVKLRTMVRSAEADGQPVWAYAGDPRVTRVGAFLRRSRFDELPQLWNVLRGEMSLIGPRPERPEFVALLADQLPLYRARHVIPPGITGWAQVKYKYGASVRDAATKLEYDLYYIRHRSLFLDAIILLETFYVVLRFRGT